MFHLWFYSSATGHQTKGRCPGKRYSLLLPTVLWPFSSHLVAGNMCFFNLVNPAGVSINERNWPPLFPIIHHDIAKEIPLHAQRLQYVAFASWLGMHCLLCHSLPLSANNLRALKFEICLPFCAELYLSLPYPELELRRAFLLFIMPLPSLVN